MPKAEVKEIIPADSEKVFELIHNYEKRLEWDTLLQKAYLEEGFEEAEKGAVAVCQGKPFLGGFALRTEYITFQKGKLAAIKMLNKPPFFDTFAASIRHRDIGENLSEVVYQFNFTAKPKWLRFVLHPLMKFIFGLETAKRLRALKKHFARS